jgi:integrase
VRPPGFGPGSTAWKADVLDQTRLRSPNTGPRSFEGNIVNVLIKLKSLGKAESTIDTTSKRLTYLGKYTDLNDPLKVSLFIANLSRANSYKANLVKAYQWYVKVYGLDWEKPKYHWEQQKPKIPTTETLISIIDRASQKYQVIFTALMETDISPMELSKILARDIDTEQNLLNVRGFKGHASRTFKLKPKTMASLIWFFKKYNSFPRADRISKAWQRLRNEVATENPNVKKIRLYDLRHFYGTMLYHKTRDILYTKMMMGHKKIETTLLYAQLIDFGSDEYNCKVAKSLEEASKLIEAGFDYVTELDGVKLFRKRK